MKRALAIYGSPRRDGVTSRLHDAFLSGLAGVEVTALRAYELDIRPCTDCGSCRDEFACVHRDGMSGLYAALRDCDLLSISSPLYFSSPPAPLKAFIDRCQVFWELGLREPGALRGKRGFFIAAGAGDYAGMFEPSVTVIRHYFNTLGCEFREEDFLLVRGTDGGLPNGSLDRARALGRKYSLYLNGGG